MRKQMNFYKKTICIILLGMLCLMSACGENKENGGSIFGQKQGKHQDLPEDVPWNHEAAAIMETETGWYTGGTMMGTGMCLRYYDKASGNTILLCNKPECQHEWNDECVATYRNIRIINALLYDGFLYVYGAEGNLQSGAPTSSKTVSLCIWRAAPDGSVIDKVGTVIEAENTQDQVVNSPSGLFTGHSQDQCFIIHQGYAYIPYYLQFGNGMIGFQGGGLMKMELATGKTEAVYTMEYPIEGVPCYLSAFGDTLYYYQPPKNGGKVFPLYRYSISEKTIQELTLWSGDVDMAFGGKKHAFLSSSVATFTKDRVYTLGHAFEEEEDGTLSILAFDGMTGELIKEECLDLDLPYSEKARRRSARAPYYLSLMPSPDGLFLADDKVAYFYDLSGKKLGEIEVPREILGIKEHDNNLYLVYKICNEKLYLIYECQDDGGYCRVLSCPLEEIYQGKGTYQDAYRMQGYMTYEKYMEVMQQYAQ